MSHGLPADACIALQHPRKHTRDTARYPPLMWATGPNRAAKSRSLREIALEHLGLVIQTGEHSPVDDARAALYLYHQHRKVIPRCSVMRFSCWLLCDYLHARSCAGVAKSKYWLAACGL